MKNKTTYIFFICFFAAVFFHGQPVFADIQGYILMEIASTDYDGCTDENYDCFCLPAGATVSIDNNTISKTLTQQVCVGDTVVFPLATLATGSHEVEIDTYLCSGGKIDSQGRCWVELETNQTCIEGCATKGMNTLSATCCEVDTDCEMLDYYFGCDSEWGFVCYNPWSYYPPMKSPGYMFEWFEDVCIISTESQIAECVSGNYCAYRDSSSDDERICACEGLPSTFELPFSI
jgi:hypothetical protein